MNSIKVKLYIFIISTILIIASGTIIFSYISNTNQVDNFYKQLTTDNAKNFASSLDGDYLTDLRTLLESEEYQSIREQAEENDNEELVKNYLIEKGYWEQYNKIQQNIDSYIHNLSNIKYLYIIAHGDKDAKYDMYLIDSSEEPLYYGAGAFEERGDEFEEFTPEKSIPTISNSEQWGWLCSDYAPIYNSEGKCIAIVGCDIEMTDVIAARTQYFIKVLIGTLALSIMVLIIAVVVISRLIIKPIKDINTAVQEFTPASDTIEAHVINLDMHSSNEIQAIYDAIRSMEINIVDYINNITNMKEDIEKKVNQINKLSVESFKDDLTHVGNKAAYLQKAKELENTTKDYALVMVDINDLKQINDQFGHKAGDVYIKGCCQIICDTFKHSPIYRIGGDEFIIVVSDNEDYTNRFELFTKLETTFNESYNNADKEPWARFSASAGLAESASDDFSVDLVFKRADKAMYEAKSNFKTQYGSYR